MCLRGTCLSLDFRTNVSACFYRCCWCNWEGMNIRPTNHQQYFAWCVHPTTRTYRYRYGEHTYTLKIAVGLSLLLPGSLSDSLLIVTHPITSMSLLLFVTELIKHGNVVSCEFMVCNIGFFWGAQKHTLAHCISRQYINPYRHPSKSACWWNYCHIVTDDSNLRHFH